MILGTQFRETLLWNIQLYGESLKFLPAVRGGGVIWQQHSYRIWVTQTIPALNPFPRTLLCKSLCRKGEGMAICLIICSCEWSLCDRSIGNGLFLLRNWSSFGHRGSAGAGVLRKCQPTNAYLLVGFQCFFFPIVTCELWKQML